MYQNFIKKSNKYFPYAVLVLVFLTGLGIGLLFNGSGKSSPIIIDKNMKMGSPAATMGSVNPTGFTEPTAAVGNFVASVNGQAYYPKDCASANRIKEENKIWFDSKEEAEAQGYRPAQNCTW